MNIVRKNVKQAFLAIIVPNIVVFVRVTQLAILTMELVQKDV